MSPATATLQSSTVRAGGVTTATPLSPVAAASCGSTRSSPQPSPAKAAPSVMSRAAVAAPSVSALHVSPTASAAPAAPAAPATTSYTRVIRETVPAQVERSVPPAPQVVETQASNASSAPHTSDPSTIPPWAMTPNAWHSMPPPWWHSMPPPWMASPYMHNPMVQPPMPMPVGIPLTASGPMSATQSAALPEAKVVGVWLALRFFDRVARRE
eukprot:CAMPEP_0115839728 /NCGR_PEP_ID=MMETSP0287-20121206/6401_1 /TAXON_ID=412157 /ORGANISM="Chrysochromulina rotalis, Strain UIO044" /LENGTH=211 /DNA_ID=CAMNT_0003293309 /DNA_START=93 /DNA_END=726 /DNA_ORIENTATION=+